VASVSRLIAQRPNYVGSYCTRLSCASVINGCAKCGIKMGWFILKLMCKINYWNDGYHYYYCYIASFKHHYILFPCSENQLFVVMISLFLEARLTDYFARIS
jgi:hypothetical protein